MAPPRASTSQLSDSTKLVKQLLAFSHGEEPEHDSDLDAEDEEITVGGKRAVTTSKGKEKQVQDDKAETTASSMDKLSLEQKQKRAPRAIRSLLRTSEHKIELQTSKGTETRTLTSWKMADYAYKREPCPYPTRARGLFTERFENDKGQEEYRIIARGYDKFFNVNEVSWTHVSSRFDSTELAKLT